MKQNNGFKLNNLYNLIICVIALFAGWLVPNRSDFLPLIGVLIIIINVRMLFLFRKASRLLLLLVIIFYINITIALFDCILQPQGLFMINEAQEALRLSDFGVVYAKCIMVFSAVFLLVLGASEKLGRASSVQGLRYSDKELPLKLRDEIRDRQNPIISYGLLAIALFVTLFTFSGSAESGYVAAGSALYEYCIFFLILSWYYRDRVGAGIVIYNTLFAICCLIYIMQGLLAGDRSSSFLLIIIIFAYFAKKINLKNTLLLVVLGIPFANLIAIYRNNAGKPISVLLADLAAKGIAIFFSDTASYSYYAGVTIVSYARQGFTGSKFETFLRWLASLVVGEGSSLTGVDRVNVTIMASKYEHNGGGGIFPSTFYFFGGYAGVILSAAVLALIIRYFFGGKKPYHILTQYTLIALSFRYYLYSSTPLFRGCIMIFGIMYLLCYGFNSLFVMKRKRADTAFENNKNG